MRQLLFLFLAIIGTSVFFSCSSTDSTTTYQVSISASPSEGGTVSPANGQHKEGTSLDISATPSEGWRFARWEGDHQGTSSTATITVNSDMNIKGVFVKKEYAITVNTEGEGTVDETVVPTGATEYEHGTVVELTANPTEGWKFVEWKGAITGTDNPVQIKVDQAKEVTAVFIKKEYELTVNTEGEGSVSEEVIPTNGTEYEYNTVVKLTANPATGWKFVEWKGAITGTDNPKQITVNEAKEVTAVFEKKSYALTVHTEGKGSVIIDPDQAEYAYQTTVTLAAEPVEGWKFVEWTGDIASTETSIDITIDQAKEVNAVFEKKSFSLTVNTEGEGTVTKDPDQAEYKYQTTVSLTAEPDEGWKFVEWTGDLTSTEASTEVTIDKDKEVAAVFEEQIFSVSTSVQGEGSVDVSPEKEDYLYKEEVEFTASAGNGFVFIKWRGALSGTQNPQTIKVTSDLNIGAIFKTPKEALIYQLGGGVYINGRVHSATLQLYNTLPESVELVRVTLKDKSDNKVVENTDETIIEPNKGIGFNISFGIQPTTEDFNEYAVEWEAIYKGKTYIKKNKVGVSESSTQNGRKPTQTIKMNIK